MKYLVWFIRLIVFVVVLVFALHNTDPVTVNFFQDYKVQNVPLIIVLFITFAVGAILAFLFMIPKGIKSQHAKSKLRNENRHLNRKIENLKRELDLSEPNPNNVAVPHSKTTSTAVKTTTTANSTPNHVPSTSSAPSPTSTSPVKTTPVSKTTPQSPQSTTSAHR
ncbi:LapA family protein [Brackiella oedipodis]|uniref:LapA family protein n=1 Tax=Brackiella oedipodis TaxID=124225 RepID=UPI000686D182|nr:LapA family protein [Brackiella oedipodis]